MILKKYPELDINKMLFSFQHYMAFDQSKVSRAEFEANLDEKLNDQAFINDIFPLLPLDYHASENITNRHNPVNDFIHIQERIIGKLPGDGWKGNQYSGRP